MDINSCNAIRRIITIRDPMSWGPVRLWDINGVEITQQSMYSWSTDGVCWTDWVSYAEYDKIARNISGEFFLRILIFGSFDKLSVNGGYIDCYTICLDGSNMFARDLCNTFQFDPYANLDCALMLQEQTSDSIICMFGIPIYYFRVVPDASTVDYTFKEYVLHNVENVKILKLMLQEGTMPSSKPQMTEFDFDWETDWEVELSKNHFARAFGDTAFPKHNDFIYVPMMKRMWSVNSAYDEKSEGFMWHSTTWKLGLVKYNDNTNISQGEFADAIDSLLVQEYADAFGMFEGVEQERESGIAQTNSPAYAANNTTRIFMSDYVRAEMTSSEIHNIEHKQTNNGGTVVARDIYKFKNPDSYIRYQRPWCGDSGTLMMLFEMPRRIGESNVVWEAGNMLKMVLDSEGKLKVGNVQSDMVLEEGSVYIMIYKWDQKNFIQTLQLFKQEIPTDVPDYMLRPEMMRFDFSTPSESVSYAYDSELVVDSKTPVLLRPCALHIQYMKLYNEVLDERDMIAEACKYTTNDERCVINDVARQVDSGYGFAVK